MKLLTGTRKVVISVAAAALTLSGLTYLYLIKPLREIREESAGFFTEVVALEVGKSTFQQIRSLLDRYNGKPFEIAGQSTGCTPEECNVAFYFENTALTRLRLAPKTALSASLIVRDGKLASRFVALATTREGKYIEAFVDEHERFESGINYRLVKYPVAPRTGIEITATASPENHKAAYAFNLQCLTRIGGCRDVQELLPTTSNGSRR